MDFIPRRIYQEKKLSGLNLRADSLANALAWRPCLLVFLRGAESIFSEEAVLDLRLRSESVPGFPKMLFIVSDSLEKAKELIEPIWSEAEIICDENLSFYTGMELQKGDWNTLYGPLVWLSLLRAVAKGLPLRIFPYGNPHPSFLPSVFLVLKDRILWRHNYKHAGDHPRWEAIPGFGAPLWDGESNHEIGLA